MERLAPVQQMTVRGRTWPGSAVSGYCTHTDSEVTAGPSVVDCS